MPIAASNTENPINPHSAPVERCGSDSSLRIADCGLRIAELRVSGFADDESAVRDPRSAISSEAVKLGSRNFSIALSPQSAAGTPRKPATIAPIASAISGYVMADGDSCGPCQGPCPCAAV